MNVLIPMAGRGSRFASQGYTFPKPLIEVNGKPMIQVVTENLNIKANYTFIVQKEHYEQYNLNYLLPLLLLDVTSFRWTESLKEYLHHLTCKRVYQQ